ncbi:MAG: hypothetical protein ACRD6X_06440, partial [Pyrinomonadaceae bacterium]
ANIVAVAAVWNLPMYLKYGWEFIDEFYVQHHFQRFTSNKYRHPQPFYFFFWVLPLMTLPWLPFFLAEMIRSLRKFFQRKDSETQNQEANSLEDLNPLRIFAFAWMLVPLVFFSVSGSKLPGYILPALPGAVILAALYIFDFVQKSDARKYAVFGVAFSTFAVIIGLLTFVVPKYADADSVKRLIETADAKGYSTSKVANFKTLSHSAEFYAAGRLLRDANGEQLRFDEFSKLKAAAQIDGQPLLVLTPMKDMSTFTNSNFESLADNGVLAIGVLSGIANNE